VVAFFPFGVWDYGVLVWASLSSASMRANATAPFRVCFDEPAISWRNAAVLVAWDA
jgi:hypothetical protein